MKKIGIILLIVISMFSSGCSPLIQEDERLSLYASFYPIYALTDGLIKGIPDIELHCLVQPQDGCFRSYQLSDWDIYMIAASADAFIMGGRGLESFEETLFALGDAGPAVSAVFYNLALYNQEDNETDGEAESHLDGPNPHLYMSVSGAEQIVESIAATLVSLDPGYADLYNDNLESVLLELKLLRDEIVHAAEMLHGKKVILMNEALVYTAQDCGLEIAHWYDRESGVGLYDSELSECLDEISVSGSNVILIEKQAPLAFVSALENEGYNVVRINIMSSGREEDGFEGYLQAHRENLNAIKTALFDD